MRKGLPLEEPMNANERFLHAIAARLDILIDLLNKDEVQEVSESNPETVKAKRTARKAKE